jgi:hypothetical protein
MIVMQASLPETCQFPQSWPLAVRGSTPLLSSFTRPQNRFGFQLFSAEAGKDFPATRKNPSFTKCDRAAGAKETNASN